MVLISNYLMNGQKHVSVDTNFKYSFLTRSRRTLHVFEEAMVVLQENSNSSN